MFKKIIDYWVKFTQYLKTQAQSPYSDSIEQRRAAMILQSIASSAFALLALWFAYYEFGSAVFGRPLVYVLLVAWIYLNLSVFTRRLDEASQKTASEKIDDLSTNLNTKLDELIIEMRGLREDVRNSSCKYPDTNL